MNYELAKELKDAGFPQTDNDTDQITSIVCKEPLVHYPTLSELIEACGEGFSFLGTTTMNGKIIGWEAQQPGSALDELARGTGPTPEAAVARLWISLNKK